MASAERSDTKAAEVISVTNYLAIDSEPLAEDDQELEENHARRRQRMLAKALAGLCEGSSNRVVVRRKIR